MREERDGIRVVLHEVEAIIEEQGGVSAVLIRLA